MHGLSGARLTGTEARLSDLHAQARSAKPLSAIAHSDDERTSLVRYQLTDAPQSLEPVELPFADARIVHSGPFDVLLGLHETMTLLVLDGPASTGRSIGMIASAMAVPDNDGIMAWTLDAGGDTRLRRFALSSSSIHEQASWRLPLSTGCGAKLAQRAEEPWVVADSFGKLVVANTNTIVASIPLGSDQRCVEDAVQTSPETLLVLTGPQATLHLVDLASGASHRMQLASTLAHDPYPHRRLAFDAGSRRAYVALSNTVAAVQVNDAALHEAGDFEPACGGESIVVIGSEAAD